MRRSSQSTSALVYRLDVNKESTYATVLDPDGECVTQNKLNEEVPTLLRAHEVEIAKILALIPQRIREGMLKTY